jgi:uncharacterized membrane protein YhaH (DUF805 family)
VKKIILTYGAISGLVIILSIILGWALMEGSENQYSQLVGYLIMVVALSVIFVGVKRYRDRELGGVIKFGRAFLLGLGISAVSGMVYVLTWEVYLSLTDYAFIGEYVQATIEGKKAAGVSGAELDALVAKMEAMKEMYGKPLFRLPMTFLEIFPVGLVISLISAAVLRNSRVLPAAA